MTTNPNDLVPARSNPGEDTTPAAANPCAAAGPNAAAGRGRRSCSIEGCENKHRTRGWCHMHHQRWRVHGDPECVQLMMPSGPLLTLLDVQPGPLTRLGGRDRKVVYRARKTGRMSERVADRIAVEHLGLTLVEIYGWDYDEGAA